MEDPIARFGYRELTEEQTNIQYENCYKCKLWQECISPVMPYSGSDNPKVLFVAEAPGGWEDEINQPFVGQAGQILRDAIEAIDLTEEDVAFSNSVRCRPPDNRSPQVREINHCKPFLEVDIEMLEPEIIVLLGNAALKSILGESGITTWAGTIVERDGVTYMPMFHPSYVDRQGMQGPVMDMWLDHFDKLARIVHGEMESRTVLDDLEITYPETVAEVKLSLLKLAKKTPWMACDIETNKLWPEHHDNMVLSIAFGYHDEAVVFPLRHPESWFSDEECDNIIAWLRKWMPKQKLVGHNMRFDSKSMLVMENVEFEHWGDTLDMYRIAYAHEKLHGLKRAAAIFLNCYDYDREIDEYKKAHKEADPERGGGYKNIPLDKLLPYNGKDVCVTSHLHDRLAVDMTEEQHAVYREIHIPVSAGPFRDLEINGLNVDPAQVEKHVHLYTIAKEQYRKRLMADPDIQDYILFRQEEEPGFAFNPNSRDQMVDVVYAWKGYDVPTDKRLLTKKGAPSASRKVLEKVVKPEEPIFFEDFRLWGLMNHMLNTFLKPPMRGDWFHGDDYNCRVNYNLGRAKTGRISSSNPTNLQNIPSIEKEWGTLLMYKPIKNIFRSRWVDIGGRLVLIDYASQELRVMASLANVLGFIKAFSEGRDIHNFVTSMLFKVPELEVKKLYNHLRYRAKWVNWTLLYGGDAWTLVGLYGLAVHEAEEMIKLYYGNFPEILDFHQHIKKFVRENGYVESIFGRRLKLQYTSDYDKRHNKTFYNKDMRTALDFPIQGPASDLLLMASRVIYDQMRENSMESLIVNTVHDSLVYDCVPDEIESTSALATNVMENLPDYQQEYWPNLNFEWLRCPLKADVDVSTHYGTKVE